MLNVSCVEKSLQDGFVKVTVITEENVTEVYERKLRKMNSSKFRININGYEIQLTKELDIISVNLMYETKGKNVWGSHSSASKTEKEEVQEPKFQIPEVKKNGEVHHEKYEQIKTCLMCNIPVYLAGPAGSGKNHTVEQIAKELGWNFYFTNSVQQEYKLTGFIDAGGNFHETEFYKACVDDNDCIFFLDEMDASIPEVLVLLNAAIANGYFEFPNGRVDLKHIHFVSAGNTVGSGADEMYTGRMVLDQATLDRFAIIDFDYSLNIEMAISKGNSELVSFIHQLRDEAKRKGIRSTFSYRCITMVTKLEKAGMDIETIILVAVMKGLDKDTIRNFNSAGDTKYHQALRKINRAA
jgi:hypothetical protein